MAKSSAKSKQSSPTPASQASSGNMIALDAFQNILARTGFGTINMMEATRYPLTRLTKNYNLMNSLYRSNWVARRVIDIIPKDMMKQWIQYTCDITPEQIDELQKTERLTRLRKSLLKGLKWGRLYGGAAGLMLIEGQEDQLEEPLDLDAVLPGDFKGLLIADRWSGVNPQMELIEDIGSPEFGLPMYYQFMDSTGGTVSKVHHSRIIRFVGDDLPEWETQAETYWGASIIESVYEEIKKRDNTSANIAGLIFLANLRVMKMSDLGEAFTGTNAKAQQNLYDTIRAQNWLMNNFSMYVMSQEDEFQQFALNNFNGLNDIYESFMLDLSGASQIPVTRLFGRSPAGLNSTGESDQQNYFDVVEQNQEEHLRPALEKLMPVLCMSSLGFVPDDIDFTFNPVYTPTDKEMGESVKWRSEAVLGYHDRGIISDQIALKEAKQMSDQAGVFSNITDEDIAKANAEAIGPMMSGEGDPEEEDDTESVD